MLVRREYYASIIFWHSMPLSYHIYLEELNMKRLLAVLLSLVMVLSLAACGDNANDNTPVTDATEPDVTEATEPVTEATTEATTTEATTVATTEPEPEPEPEPKPVYVADMFTAIPVTADNFGRGQVANELIEADNEALTWAEGNGVTIVGATLVSFKLPEGVTMGNTICVHIKGESVGNFRTWLIDDGEVTSSEQHNMETDYGFTGGEFDEIIEYTVQYVDNTIADDTATQFAFKASSWNTTLDGLTITEVGVYNGTLEEYKAATADAVPAEGEDASAEGEVTTAPEGEDAPAEDGEDSAEGDAE